MTRSYFLYAILIIALGAVIGGLFGKFPSATQADTSVTPAKISADFREALEVIEKSYVGKPDSEKTLDSAVQGMLWSLDPHSQFFTRDEFRKLYEEQSSQFYGIGVSILQHRDGVYVQSVIPGTPADKAGIRYGDRFIEVDGKDAREWTSAEVSKNVRGERGTKVKVKIERATTATPVEFEITRGGVPLPSIRNYFLLSNGVGYIGLTGGFQETTSAELNDAIEDLQKRGMTSLVLDVRGNPGGLLPQAIDVVSKFIPSGQTVVSVKGRSRYAISQELRSRGGEPSRLPLVVLVNGGSASASEIVAGAVQDYRRGLVVGSDSFGKGLVQRVFPLPYGTGLTLTTARFYTPFGRSLQRDYSNGSIYEYFTNGGAEDEEAPRPKPAGVPVKLPDGRVLMGGRGIEPDVAVKGQAFNQTRFRINDAAFYFVRQLVAGKISGLESYKVDRQNHQWSIAPDAFPITDPLFDAFKAYTLANKQNALTAENLAAEADYARMRLRMEIATANYSNEAGIQVLLERDPQVLKAVEVMPEARGFVDNNLASK
ncbi:MAG: S41 family peptidase [Acidobacteria bacterium]|mgnify:FL=1|nr:S41 family peptidase [Acidobacteriota bacterium]